MVLMMCSPITLSIWSHWEKKNAIEKKSIMSQVLSCPIHTEERVKLYLKVSVFYPNGTHKGLL